ncbi:MAG: hypothetical protein QOJ56_5690 [Mycobacterium sp.]|nr:hypothetical protein [Mycobacterium sp.]
MSVEDTLNGSAYPRSGPVICANRDQPFSALSLRYRGCTRGAPRKGVARTAPTWVLRAAGHDHGRRAAAIHLDLGPMPWAGVPCWTGRTQRWATFTVPAAYDLRYADIRVHMCNGGIARTTLVRVAGAMAEHADYRTGRNSRASNERLAGLTGLSIRSVQRAKEALRLLGVATEILRGRQRTRHERMASWRVGDRGRGWASVWTLHDPRYPQLSPHPEGSQLSSKTPVLRKLTTASRHSGRSAATRRISPDPGAALLAQRWVGDPHSPAWARRYRTSSAWVPILTGAARHRWTPRDVNQLISDYRGAGNWVPDSPHKPIGLLGAMFAWHASLEERPAAADDAREAEQLAADRARLAQQLVDREASKQARAAGKAALAGPGHAAARQALTAALERIRSRRQPEQGPQ